MEFDKLWKHDLALLELTENRTPRHTGWMIDPSNWFQTPEDLPTRLDPVTKIKVPYYPPYMGILTGQPSHNIGVLDVDNKNNAPFEEVCKHLKDTYGISPETTMAVRTKNGGLHLYLQMDVRRSFSCRIGIPIDEIEGKTGLDFRGSCGFAVSPPTEGYSFINDLPPMEPPPHFYEWFIKKERQHEYDNNLEERLKEAFSDEGLTKGERNDKLFRIGAKLAYAFANNPDGVGYVYHFLISAADKCNKKYRSEKKDAELYSIAERCMDYQATVNSGIKPEISSPTPKLSNAEIPHWYDMKHYDAASHIHAAGNELGLALRIVSMTPNLVWRPDTNRWWYKDVVWRAFEEQIDIRNLRQLCVKIINADKKAGAPQSTITKMESLVGKHASFKGLLDTLRTYTTVASNSFNSPSTRNWVGFKNGALNIITNEFMLEVPDDVYATTAFNYEYQPDAKAKHWPRFVEHMFKGDQEMIDFFPVLLGYCLLGQNKDAMFFLFIGAADAGKSTLSRILTHLFDGNASIHMHPRVFAGGSMSEGTKAAHLIPAANARLVIANEVSNSEYLNEEDIKRMTGGDVITVRENYAKANFSYIPSFTPIMVGNDDPPFFSAASAALKRRLVKIQLNNPVTADVRRKNPTIEQDVIDEVPAVFNLIHAGMHKYLRQKDRLETMFPASIREATSQFFEDADVFRGFFNEELHFESGVRGRAHNLRAAFLAYQNRFMLDEHKKKLTISALAKRLKDSGVSRRRSNGVDYWIGVRLKKPTESVNGMVLQPNYLSEDKSPIFVTFGQVYDALKMHNDNEQDFMKKQLKSHSNTTLKAVQ